ncbi:PfkB family carbohydrate kinase [Pseudoduganella buxea]|uniref:Carbohydrate kinase n=1 Tax=Pseudoduganella buxea TaxID=1949069 RepID=A0A6I3SX61_9BURK|nr:PfkB family carbohydrate kinase [Pseudoduganella buxea]MTV53644.1 carbohydrate kinase [Pseudoduganella buxea]GGB83986.1 carbohydrate kinase [Pseudoduganella buxea]
MVVTFGEALVDMIEMPDGRFAAALGGAVCNFAVAAARQQMDVTYLNPLSQDSFGQGFARLLAQAGIHLASPTRSARPTSLAIVTLDADGSPSYAFHRECVADRDIAPAQACAMLPPSMSLFHTGGLALVPDDIDATLAVIAAAAAAGALVSIDANLRPRVCGDLPSYAAGVRRALALAHLIKVSEEDLLHLGYGGMAPLGAARMLLDTLDVSLIALTLGAQGAVLLSRRACITLGAPEGIDVVDTVGCGDSFLAGLVASLAADGALSAAALDDADDAVLERALCHGVAAASLNAMRQGCQPPGAADVAQFLASGAMPQPRTEKTGTSDGRSPRHPAPPAADAQVAQVAQRA